MVLLPKESVCLHTCTHPSRVGSWCSHYRACLRKLETMSSTSPSALTAVSRLPQPVLVSDRINGRARRAEDAFDLTLCILGIGSLLLLSTYAHSTTAAVAQDVRSALTDVLHQILLLPITFVESAFILIAPVAIVGYLLLKSRFPLILEAVAASVVTVAICTLLQVFAQHLPVWLLGRLLVSSQTGTRVAIDAMAATMATLLTVSGESNRNRLIRYSWFALFTFTSIHVLRSTLPLSGALISVLLGRLVGVATRWIMGVTESDERLTDLVDALLGIGIIPTHIVRTDVDTTERPLATFEIHEVPRERSVWNAPFLPLGCKQVESQEPRVVNVEVPSLRRSDANLHYACWDEAGNMYELLVLDPDARVYSLLKDLWNNLRLRGLSRALTTSTTAMMEREALVKIAAHKAGVATPAVLGLGESGALAVTVQQRVPGLRPLTEIPNEELDDTAIVGLYAELKTAHEQGITHRVIDQNSLAFDESNKPWLLNWEDGNVAASSLSQRIDIAQLVTAVSLKIGTERAVTLAQQVFGKKTITFASPTLQPAILPTITRKALRENREMLTELRSHMTGEVAEEEVPTLNLQRFSMRTVAITIIGVIALWVLLGSLNFQSVIKAVSNANPWWIIVAVIASLVTYLGAAIPLKAFSPEKISLHEATLVQVAASIVTMVAPAGVGPAALNLRFLNKRRVDTPVGIATVALVQVSQLVITITALLFIVIFTGRSATFDIETSTIVWVVVVVCLITIAITAVPRIRTWIWSKIEPTWNQMWSRLVWIVSEPRRLIMGILGNLLNVAAFVTTFGACLAAFNYSLDVTTLTVTYLASNSLGSVVPSPGGVGPVEATLTAGLTVVGVPGGIAISTALLYRLVTFYGRAPLGWIALRILQKRDLV